MIEKLKKNPWISMGIVALLAALVFVFTELNFRFFAEGSTVFVIFAALLSVTVSALLFLGCVLREKFSLRFTLLLTLIYNFVFLLLLILIPFAFRGMGQSDYHAAKYTAYIALACEVVGYVLFFLTVRKTLAKKIMIAAIALVCAVSVTLGVCWGVLDNAIFLYAKNNEWELEAPEYEGGKLSEKYNSGVMLADEVHGPSGEETYMQAVSNTNEKQFFAYCKKLLIAGYTQENSNEMESILSKTFTKDGKLLHVYYNKNEKTTRILTDPVSSSPLAFSYAYAAQPNDTTAIYQYALLYDDNCGTDYTFNGGVERCGMNYVIKLADNRLIVIDGGDSWQSSDATVEGFYNFCKEITGSEDGTFTVACWINTHAHSDHIEFFSKFLRVYQHERGLVTLERYMFNHANYEEVDMGSAEAVYTLKKRLQLYAPDALRVKPHTGESFTLANVKIDILYTHEDAFDYRVGKTSIVDFNDTSTVYRFTVGDKVFLLLADSNYRAQDIMSRNYTEKTLKADIVQVAHHGYNNLDKLYPLIDPDYAFYPQGTENGLGENSGAFYNYKVIKKYTDKIYFTDKFTYGLIIDSQGEITEDTPRPYVGPDVTKSEYFDGSAV